MGLKMTATANFAMFPTLTIESVHGFKETICVGPNGIEPRCKAGQDDGEQDVTQENGNPSAGGTTANHSPSPSNR